MAFLARVAVWTVIGLCIVHQTSSRRSCSIELQNNGFSLMVGIADGVPRQRNSGDRHDYEDLLVALRREIGEASSYLYQASDRRAYIKDVTIVVPSDYQTGGGVAIGCARECETYERAKIKVRQPRVDGRGRELHGAYVIPSSCGEEGSLMHLTASRMASPRHQGSPADRMFVHELAHLRWGVGDEYYQSFYGYGSDGKPSRCSITIEPQRSEFTGRYSRFNLNGATGSVMWQQFRREMIHFCEDNASDRRRQHNRQAANSHNMRCSRDSAWTVMRRSRDFARNNNPPRNIPERDLQPTIRFVKKCQAGSCQILVIDISASMTGRMLQVQQAAATVINRVPSHHKLGMITFAQRLYGNHPLRDADPATKNSFKAKLPRESDVRPELTDIRKAIVEAAKILNDNPSCHQKKLTIVSDCGVTSGDDVDDMLIRQLRSDRITVDSLTLDDNTPRCMLSELSRLSEGVSCNQGDPLGEDAALEDCLAPQSPKGMPGSEQRLHFSMTTLAPEGKVCKPLCIEHDIGRDTTFTLNWNKLLSQPMAERMWHLIAPSGRKYRYKRVQNFELDNRLMMSSFKLASTESGTWKVCLHNKHSADVTYTLNINSHTRHAGIKPIEVEGYLTKVNVNAPETQTLMVEVTKGGMPVLDAMVTCTVTRPSSPPRTLVLHDNYFGSDDMMNDGIYTAIFTQYMGNGQYNVHCQATCKRNVDDSFQTRLLNRPKRMDDPGETGDQLMSGMGMEDEGVPDTMTEMDHCCFTRQISLGSFYVHGYSEKNMQVLERDMVPPSAIKDLQVVDVASRAYPYTIELKFSATGDDMEVGDASFYELRWGTMFATLDNDTLFNASHASNEFTIRGNNPLERPPKRASETSMLSINFRVEICLPAMENNEVFFALKALDKAGNVSPLSNIARVEFDDQSYLSHCPANVRASERHRCCNKQSSFNRPDLSWMEDTASALV